MSLITLCPRHRTPYFQKNLCGMHFIGHETCKYDRQYQRQQGILAYTFHPELPKAIYYWERKKKAVNSTKKIHKIEVWKKTCQTLSKAINFTNFVKEVNEIKKNYINTKFIVQK